MSIGKLIARLCVGGLLVYLLLHKHGVNWLMIIERMSEIPPLTLALALGINLAGQALSAFRWSTLSEMGGRPVRYLDALNVYFCGMFFNICLPTSIGGDVFRVVGLGRKTGSKTAAFASVFMDRNVGLGGLLAVGLFGSVMSQTTVRATIYERLFEFQVWPAFLVLIIGYVLVNIALFNETVYAFATSTLKTLHLSFFVDKLKPLHDAVKNYHLPLAYFMWPFVISLVYQASEAGLICVLGRSMGLNLSIWAFCSMMTFQAVASLLPITFSGVGIREAIFTSVVVGKLGPAFKDEALALAVVYFFGIVLVSSLIGGIVYLVGGITKPTAVEIAQPVTDGPGGE
ncbi:MAG: lysylphosphatidylglycerol synthase transmembrane domain-containing protein [Planctomycetota bacterium]